MIRWLSWVCFSMAIVFGGIEPTQKEFWFIWVSVLLIIISDRMEI